MMKITDLAKLSAVALALGTFSVAGLGCESSSSSATDSGAHSDQMEKASDHMDAASDHMEDASDHMEDAKSGNMMDDTVDKAVDSANDAMQEAGEGVKDAMK